MYIQSGQEVRDNLTCQPPRGFIFQRSQMVAAKRQQKKPIRRHLSNEESLAFVPAVTIGPCDMDPSQTGKVDTYCEGASLARQRGPSNYDIIFLPDFSESSHFTQRARE